MTTIEAPKTTPKEVTERVSRGAAWLDKKLGRGWRRKIRVSKLRMERGTLGPNGCGCILTQLYGAYDRSEGPLGFDSGGRFAVSRGFMVSDQALYGSEARAYYDALTEAWKAELRKPRQAAERSRETA